MKTKQLLRAEAEIRQEAHAKRSAKEQLLLISTRRGKSKREAARIKKSLASPPPGAT